MGEVSKVSLDKGMALARIDADSLRVSR